MDEEKIITQAAKELDLKGLAPEIYKDLLQPAARELGFGLVKVAKAVCIATAPFELSVWGYEQIREHLATSLTEKLSKYKAEDIVSPRLNIAGPILNNFIFISEESELKEMYANLLASAMHSKTVESIHPSFAFVIQQLSSEEALLIQYLSTLDDGWVCDALSDTAEGYLETKSISDQFKNHCLKAQLKNISMFSAYMENLIRLRILFSELLYETNYVPAGEHDFRDPPSISQKSRDVIAVSEYGWSFINACTNSDT